MKQLYIIGAGGFGREVLAWARDCEIQGTDWRVAGFLDDNPNALGAFEIDVKVVGSISDFKIGPGDVFVCAIGAPAIKRDCIERLGSGAQFANIVHPTAIIGPRVTLGNGVIICPFSVLTTDICVGDHTSINIRCSVGHDATIGKFCQLSSFCDITGGVTIGDEVLLGSHATVMPNVSVENRATIGAGSVALMRVKEGTTVFGVPAKRL